MVSAEQLDQIEALRREEAAFDFEDEEETDFASSEGNAWSNDDSTVAVKRALSKKESPSEHRNKELRRQQAARWDIGFGKRAAPGKDGAAGGCLLCSAAVLCHTTASAGLGTSRFWPVSVCFLVQGMTASPALMASRAFMVSTACRDRLARTV